MATSRFLVDAHVHVHSCYPISGFLDAAADNVVRAAKALDMPSSTPGLLLLTQSREADAAAGLSDGATGAWRRSATEEAGTVRLTKPGHPDLFFVAGRQVATAEGLEVLALGATGPFPDGEPAAAVIDAVCELGGLPVIPWGFGKWWGRRGELVRQIAADRVRFPVLFIGDSAGRPRAAARPRLLAEAEALGRLVLPGTDPLPFAAEVTKPARLVFVAGPLSLARPFAALRDWLLARADPLHGCGSHESLSVFLHRQCAMQLRKVLAAR